MKPGRGREALESAWTEYQARPSPFNLSRAAWLCSERRTPCMAREGDGRGQERQFGIAHRIIVRGEGSQRVDGTPKPRQRWRVGGTESLFCNGTGGEGACPNPSGRPSEAPSPLCMRILNSGKSKYYYAALASLEQARKYYQAAGLLEQWSVLVVEIRGIITASRARW